MSSKRSTPVDCVRGAMMCAVILINAQYFFNSIAGVYSVFAWDVRYPGLALVFLSRALLEFKAWYLLGCLFGFYSAVRLDPVRGDSGRRRYRRRIAILLTLGILHFTLLSPVDILMFWAASGLVLFAVSRWPLRRLVSLWICAQLAVLALSVGPGPAALAAGHRLSWRVSPWDMKLYEAILLGPGVRDARGLSLVRGLSYLKGAPFTLSICLSAALLGAIVHRLDPAARLRALRILQRRRMLVLAAGLALAWGYLRAISMPFVPSWAAVLSGVLFPFVTPLAALTYGAHLHQLAGRLPAILRNSLAWMGRHSLPVYIGQSAAMAVASALGLVQAGSASQAFLFASVVIVAQGLAGAFPGRVVATQLASPNPSNP